MTTNKKAAPAEAASKTTATSDGCDYIPRDRIAMLSCDHKLYLTKTYCSDGTRREYDYALSFKVKDIDLEGWGDWYQAIADMSKMPHSTFIRGKFIGKGTAQPGKTKGSFVRTNGNFEDQPLHWFMVDVDKFDPGPIDPVRDTDLAVQEFIKSVLAEKHPEFLDASYVWQLSSSAGMAYDKIKPDGTRERIEASGKLKVHIHFISRTAYTSAQMYAWAMQFGERVDKAVYQRVQIHFLADPIFEEGITDPVEKRVGFHQGTVDYVDLKLSPCVLAAVPTGAGKNGNDMKLVDPSEKPGIIGLFHQTFDAEDVLLTHLDEFEQISERRYTWHNGGGTPEGVWVHDDGMHVDASHNTWPIDGIANLWDVVRVFKFGHLDHSEDDFVQEDIDNRGVGHRPSDFAMLEWAGKLPELHTALVEENKKSIGSSILKGIARLLRRDNLEELAEEVSLDVLKVDSIYQAVIWDPIKSKFWLITPKTNSVLSSEKDLRAMIEEHYGQVLNLEAVTAAVKDSAEERGWDLAKAEGKAAAKALLKEIMDKPTAYISRKTKAHRQATKLEIQVDMFSTEGRMCLVDGIATMIFPHLPFAVGDIDQAVIHDYKAHFPEFDDFIYLLAASRFASSRKKSHLWLNCDSDWGKSFLMGALDLLGLVVETSVGELAKMLDGGPVAKTINEFRRVWCLAIDEFKGVTREVKQMSEYINFAPKGLSTIRAPLYLKLFMSAESVDSLASKDSGIEDQFANRFLYLAGRGSIEARAVFMESKRRYLLSLVAYIAQHLNDKVEYFRSQGPEKAMDVADNELVAMYEKYRIDRKFERLSGKLQQIARRFAEDCAEAYAIHDRHGRGTKFQREAGPYVFDTPGNGLCLGSPVTVLTLWIEDTYGRTEGGKLSYKKDQIIDALGGTKTIAGFGKDRKKGIVLDIPVPDDGVEGDFID